MTIAQSKLTSQGQISIPAEIRRKLGLAPGSVLEWYEDGKRVIVRRAASYTSEDIHHALFAHAPASKSLTNFKEGIRRQMKKRHARR